MKTYSPEPACKFVNCPVFLKKYLFPDIASRISARRLNFQCHFSNLFSVFRSYAVWSDNIADIFVDCEHSTDLESFNNENYQRTTKVYDFICDSTERVFSFSFSGLEKERHPISEHIHVPGTIPGTTLKMKLQMKPRKKHNPKSIKTWKLELKRVPSFQPWSCEKNSALSFSEYFQHQQCLERVDLQFTVNLCRLDFEESYLSEINKDQPMSVIHDKGCE